MVVAQARAGRQTGSMRSSTTVRVRLERDSRGETLIVGNLHHRMPGYSSGYPFDGGTLRENYSATGGNTLEWLRPGRETKQIDLRALLNRWLKNDAIWGGQLDHHMVTGGMDVALSEFHPLPSGQALGILNFRYLGSSIPWTEFQFLVKFTAKPFKMTTIRRLPGTGTSPYQSAYENPRLYAWSNRLYCIDKDTIDLVDDGGKPTARLCNWHAVPLGLCDGRWIIGLGLAPSQTSETTIVAVDLSTGRSKTLLRYRWVDVHTQTGWQISGPKISEDSPYLLFQEAKDPDPSRSSSEATQRCFTVHLPDGGKTYVQGALGQFQVGQYVVARGTGDRFEVWSAESGQQVGTHP